MTGPVIIPIALGSSADVATVQLAPEIVPLLSEQLYQSPLKAIEELVVNSYDADAKQCYVQLNEGSIAVTDDGIGMDIDALKNLWYVGRSEKRTSTTYAHKVKRTQIGKFGIGKLAAYSIARVISFYTRSGADLLHATLDFTQFDARPASIDIPIYRVAPNQRSLLGIDLHNFTDLPAAFFDRPSWTVCILTQLRKKAEQIRGGRLQWVLRTAMPITEGFVLFLNGEPIVSSKETSGPIVEFDATSFPKERLTEFEEQTKTVAKLVDDRITTPELKQGVRFRAAVYENIISTGKSVDLTRSNGFFVRVRDRLINEKDELFGLTPQSYKSWNRFRAILYADDLDDQLTASREGVEESPAVVQTRSLASQIFLEARIRYEKWANAKDEASRGKREAGRNPVSPRLIEIPVADTVARYGVAKSGAEADSDWFYVDFNGADQAELLKTLYGPRSGVYSYRLQSLGANERVVKFHPLEKLFILNEDHPLIREYRDEDHSSQRLLQDFVTAEALLEVYLREAGVGVRIIGEILEERDKLIRSLARDQMYSLIAIAAELEESSDKEYDLEISLVASARALGFIAKHVGGGGKPDGIARFIDNNSKETIITLEAKSSTSTPSLSAIDFAGIDEHMKSENAAGCLLVAPGYPGGTKGSDASVANRANEIGCSCWTVKQLADVVRAAESREISARDVLEIIKVQFAPDDVAAAVKKLLTEPTSSATEVYTDVVEAMERLVARNLGKALNIDMVLAIVGDKKTVDEKVISQAVRVIARASKGLVQVSQDGGEIVVLGAFEEIRRRLGNLTKNSITARKLGSFRKG